MVSLNLRKQRYFNYGQVYVALSRATSLEGLHILGEMQSKHVNAKQKVNEEYERLRDSSPYFDILAEEQYLCDPVFLFIYTSLPFKHTIRHNTVNNK